LLLLLPLQQQLLLLPQLPLLGLLRRLWRLREEVDERLLVRLHLALPL
jgi:hypothetical protein